MGKIQTWNLFRSELTGSGLSISEVGKLWHNYKLNKFTDEDLDKYIKRQDTDIKIKSKKTISTRSPKKHVRAPISSPKRRSRSPISSPKRRSRSPITSPKRLTSDLRKSKSSLSQQSTDIWLLMVKNMEIKDVLNLCETNKAFNKKICKNDIFWSQRLKRDFGSIKKEEGRSYYQEYVRKVKIRNIKIIKEYNEYPGLEKKINIWLKNTSKELNIMYMQLEEWPEVLKGKEHLIVKLSCYNNQFTFLPALPNCKWLYCSHNQLTTLPALPNCVDLSCSHNQLTSLPALPKCVELHCYENLLTSLPALPKCVKLWCNSNQLTSLPVLTKCVELQCSQNLLTTLPALSKCVELYCFNNQLTFLPVLTNCVRLFCYNNLLIFLPALPKCVTFNCYNNRLTSLPLLPLCVNLFCSNNQLTSLPTLPSIRSKNDIDASNNLFPPNYTHRLL